MDELNREKQEKITEKSKWINLKYYDKILIISAAAMETLFMGMIILNGKMCFRDFEISNKISNPIAKGGLDGNVMNIIKPLGKFAILLFFVGTTLILIERKIITNRIKNQPKQIKN